MSGKEFGRKWLARFDLPEDGWRKELETALVDRPFCEPEEALSLISYLLGALPRRIETESDPVTLALAEALGWACLALWQCGSSFPSFPENYGLYLRDQLELAPEKRADEAELLAGIILGGAGAAKEERGCGFNRLVLESPEVVRDSERLVHEGRYEDYLKAGEKYEEYEKLLRASGEFQEDWAALKRCFPGETGGGRRLHRTLIPERNWERGEGARFGEAHDRFQALFDLFCWKYCLWGMDGDEPMLLKASVTFTPFGTQIFIPGYLSFDAKRDLDFAKIGKLHRARGMQRQGPAFSVGRMELEQQRRQAREADQMAQAQGLRGGERYRFICERINFIDEPDYRRVRKLLEREDGPGTPG